MNRLCSSLGIILFSSAIGLLASLAAATAADIEIGMNYNWWRFMPKAEEECRAHPAAAFRGNWLLPQYQDENIRRTVQNQLREMLQSGLTLLKIMVIHRRPNLSRDSEFFFSADGSWAPRDKTKLQDFVSDIAAAGFRGLEVSPGFMDQNRPFCRLQEWGDCFDPQRTGENWRFISEVTKAVMEKKGKLSVLFDLSTEGACPAASMEPNTLLNTKQYVQAIADRWRSQFGDNWVMSCPNSAKAARLDLLVEDLAEAGIQPKYVEIHNYETDPRTIDATLDEVQKVAERLDAHAILGEMQYHSDEKTAVLAEWLKGHPASRFIAMMMWPLREPEKACPMDTAPPYTPGPLAKIRGN
jgi:hypothetical protein